MTQLCVSLPVSVDPDGARLLAQALETGVVRAVVIEPEAPDGAVPPAAALPLIAVIQKAGAAALIRDDAHLARTLKADGVHLTPRPDIVAAASEAREILGQSGIVGVDTGGSRHDAMEAGEQAVDYIAFSLPDAPDDDDIEERLELVSWWAEIFEVPVVAYGVQSAQEAAALAAADADFVSIDLRGVASPAEHIRAIVAAVAAATPEAVS